MHRKTHYVLPSARNAADNASDVLRALRHMYNAARGSSKHHPQLQYRDSEPTEMHTRPNNSRNPPPVPCRFRIRDIREFVYSGRDNVMRLIAFTIKDAVTHTRDIYTYIYIFTRRS